MDKGSIYVFYNNKYNFGRDVNKVMIGEYIGNMENGSDAMVFKIPEGEMKFSNNAYDKLNPGNNTNNFIEYLAGKFQNEFQKNVSVWHENYEFKIQFSHEGNRVLDDVEAVMNESLEDWWSVSWQELEYNSIQVYRNDIIVSFRVHDVHEIQFRYNDMEGK
jgi:hypothetical protein